MVLLLVVEQGLTTGSFEYHQVTGIDGQLGIFGNIPTGSFESTTNDLQVTGSVTISSSVVDLVGATAISGSTFSGSFVGSGAGLTGVPASGIDGQLGIFAQTGSIEQQPMI